MLKWGNTEVTIVKWGNTNCTVVKWGNTVVFPTNNGFDVNSGTFVAPIASGLYYFPNFGGDSTLTTGTAFTGNKTSLAYTGSNRVTFVSKTALTAAQWNQIKQVRIVARWIVYNASMVLDSDMYFSAASSSGMGIYMNKDSNTSAFTSNSSNGYKWANCSGWLHPWQAEWYYNALDWCGQTQSTTGSRPQGSNVIVTHTQTIDKVSRFQGTAYLGIAQYPNVTGCPGVGAYKYFRVELQSIEILTSIKY
jgi:hypothetical protein